MSIVYALENYWANKRIILLFSLSIIAPLLLSFILSESYFYSLGGLFLRISNLPYVNILYFLLFMIIFTIVVFLISFVFTGISLIVKEGMLYKIRNVIFKELFFKKLTDIFLFFLLTSLFVLLIKLIAFILNINPIITSLLIYLFYYLIFFIPYAMIIDDYSLNIAIIKSFELLKNKPYLPLLYTLVGGLFITLPAFFLSLFFNYNIVMWILLLLNVFFIAPFMIIYGAHIYLKKYPILS